MENTRRKLLETITYLEDAYYSNVDVFIKEIAAKRKDSEEVQNVLIAFSNLINSIKQLKETDSN